MGSIIAFPAVQQGFESELQMVIGAEYIQSPTIGNESLAEVITLRRIDFEGDCLCVNSDIVPGLLSVRQQARAEAERILEQNRQLLRSGEFSLVPLDVDALGTVAKVSEIKETHGEDSGEYAEAREGLRLDCSRKWAEAFRKNSWEYFGETVQHLDPVSGELIAHNLSVDEMLSNGLSPVSEQEELQLRVNDFIGLHINKELVTRADADHLASVRILPCPDWAIKSYQRDSKGAHGGYAPEIEKLMISYDWFDSSDQTIHHEQIGVAGTFITTEVISKTLKMIGAIDSDTELGKTDIHGTVGIVSSETITSAADVLKILDEVASDMSGIDVFMGEQVKAGYDKDYGRIYSEAAKRKEKQANLSEDLTKYVEDLYNQSIEPALATVLVENYIQKTLLKIASEDPVQAEIIFNKETAEGFYEVKSLQDQGRFQEAKLLLESVEMDAPRASSCGAGSCGLEAINAKSTEGKELLKKLDAEAGDEILRDKERSCRGCGAKKLVYAFNKNKVNTLCEGCGALVKKKQAK